MERESSQVHAASSQLEISFVGSTSIRFFPPLSPTKVRSRRSKSRGRRRRKSQRRGTVAFAEGPILSPQTENCPSAINVKTPHHVHFTRRKKRYISSIAKFARTPPEEEMAAKDRMNVHLLTLSSVKTLDFGEPWFSKKEDSRRRCC